MPRKTPAIDYTSRDFSRIKNDLMEYAKRYYPDTFKDFSKPSFGALLLDTVSYVGDILSFYTDYQANESFLSTAIEYDNILKLSNALGYKFKPYPSSTGLVTIYALIPADSMAAPDENYMPIMKRGSAFTATGGARFTLVEDLDFSNTTNEIVVANVDSATGAPTSYAVKMVGQVVSGEYGLETITVGDFQKFLRLRLGANNINEIISVTDSSGNQYYEVDYLSQDIVYVPVINRDTNKDVVANILKPITVSRRFMVDQSTGATFLQFGYGSDESPTTLADPSEVVLELHGKDYDTDATFDPSVLNETDKLGVVPSNTSLSIVYRANNVDNVNAAANTVNAIAGAILEFTSPESLTAANKNFVRDSLAVTNEEAIVGDVLFPTTEELRLRAMSNFATQNRAVTREDYVSMIYRMPSKYGTVKKAAIVQDEDSFNQRNLNIYIASENTDGKLIKTNSTIKSNLKTWINQYKMINDTIEVMDAKIVNLGINFVVDVFPNVNKSDAINAAVNNIASYFSTGFDLGEPLMITDIWRGLTQSPEIMDVISVEIVAKEGGLYSDYSFNIFDAKTADGRLLIAPPDTVFEIKYPDTDIVGTVR